MNENRISVSEITVELLKDLTRSLIGIEDGKEYPNPKKDVITGIYRPPTLKEQIQRVLRTELSNQAEKQGFESFEDANDFDIEEDIEPVSEYELREMVEEVPNSVEKVVPSEELNPTDSIEETAKEDTST